MFFNSAPGDPLFAYELAQMTWKLRDTAGEQAIMRDATRLKPAPQAITFDRANEFIPGAAWISWADTLLVLLDGVTRLNHGVQYITQASLPIDRGIVGGVNLYLLDWANQIFDRLQTERVSRRQRIVIVGHSLGGAMAPILAMLLASQGPTSISCVTFGSPRSGPENFTRMVSGLDLARYMGWDDPVPHIPPRQNQAPLVHSLITTSASIAWNAYVQSHGGLVLAQAGNTVPGDLPPTNSVIIGPSIAAWLYSTRNDEASGHSMATYVDRLRIRVQRMVPGNPPSIGGHRAESQPTRLTHSEVIVANSEQQAQMRQAAGEVRAVPVRFPRLHEMSAVKIGSIWCVSWQKQIVAVGPGRRAARDLARAGNTFLRRLQRAGSLAPDAMIAAAELYLAAATDEGGPFRPVQQTS